jgi:hypothetical protein
MNEMQDVKKEFNKDIEILIKIKLKSWKYHKQKLQSTVWLTVEKVENSDGR